MACADALGRASTVQPSGPVAASANEAAGALLLRRVRLKLNVSDALPRRVENSAVSSAAAGDVGDDVEVHRQDPRLARGSALDDDAVSARCRLGGDPDLELDGGRLGGVGGDGADLGATTSQPGGPSRAAPG